MSSEKFFSIMSALLAVAGVAMLAGAIWMARDSVAFLYDVERTEGHVVELVEKEGRDGDNNHMMMWYPVIEFSVQGQMIRFESGMGSNPSHYSMGQPVKVIYKSNDPHNARIDSKVAMWYSSGFLGSFGLMALLGAAGLAMSVIMRRRERDRLISIGHVIITEIYNIMPDTSMSVRGMHPYRILSRYHHMENNRTYVFESDPIWYNPQEFFAEKKELSVYVDPQDFSKYYIDISFLPKVKIEVEM